MKKFFQRWFQGSDPCLGITICPSSVAMACAIECRGGISVECIVRSTLTTVTSASVGGNPTMLGALLQDFLAKAAHSYARCALVLPFEDLFSAQFQLPPQNDFNDSHSLLTWAVSQLPFDSSEVIGQVRELAGSCSSSREIELIAAKRSTIQAYSESIADLGLELDIITDRVAAVSRALTFYGQNKATAVDILIDASDEPYALYFSREGHLLSPRVLNNRGMEMINDLAQAVLTGREQKKIVHVAIYGAPKIATSIEERLKTVASREAGKEVIRIDILSPLLFHGSELCPLVSYGVAMIGADAQ